MGKDWYCRIAGQVIGPFSAAQLRVLADEGRLSPGDPLRQGVSGVWVPAASVKGLFPKGHLRPPLRPTTDRTETHAKERSRPLLRAVPIEDAVGPSEVSSLSRLLDEDDAGIDLASHPPESPSSPPSSPQPFKGWRWTGLDFLAEEPPTVTQPAERQALGEERRARLGKKAGVRLAAKARRDHEGDPAEPIRRWTLPVLVAILIVLLAVWLILGRVDRFWAVDGQGDRATSVTKTASPKTAPAAGTTETRAKAPPASSSKPTEPGPKKATTAERGPGFRPPPLDPSGKKDAGARTAPSSPKPEGIPPKTLPPAAKRDEPPLPKPTGQPKTDFGIE
jgi:hypothetical protein